MFRVVLCAFSLLFVAPNLLRAETVKFRFEATSLSGEVVDSLFVGDQFFVNAYAEFQAIEAPVFRAEGVFAAYLDVTYDAALAQPSSEAVVFGDVFMNGRNADLSTLGVVNDVGGFGGIDVPQELENLVFRLSMKANSPGQFELTGSSANASPVYDVLVHHTTESLPTSEIDFGSLSIRIADVPEPTSQLLLLSAGFACLAVRRKRN